MIKELYSISNKTVYFKKSFVEEFRKSAADAKLLEFKKRLIAILEEKEREEEENFQSINKAFQVNEIFKSLTAPFRFMEKGGRVGEIGEIRTWNGKKYKKMPNKEWTRVYDEETRGAKLAVAALKKKIDACTNSQELLNLILANKERFCDNLGRPLPIVQKLSEFAGAKNDRLETPNNSRTKQNIQKENTDTYKEKVYSSFGFNKGVFSKDVLRDIAGNANLAKAEDIQLIDVNNIYDSAKKYISKLISESDDKEKWIKCPLLKNARIRFNGQSYRHFFTDKNGNDRPLDEITSRAKCLPFVKDILSNSGVKASYSTNENGQTSFVIMGKAKIDNKETAIKIIIKTKDNKFFYLSLNNFGEIKKATGTSNEAMTKPSTTQSPKNNIAQDYTVVNKKDKENPAVKKSFASIVNELKKSYFDNIGA